jgi:hypothetical protein
MPTIEKHGLTFDARPDRVDFRDLFYQPPLVSLAPEYPPRELVERNLVAYCDDGMILNQGSEGACAGFGLAAVINYLYWERPTPQRHCPAQGSARACSTTWRACTMNGTARTTRARAVAAR